MNTPCSIKIETRALPPALPLDYPYPWQPDQGDGTYRNPVLHTDYSDPDVIRVGGDFYLTASSFNCTPGLPILHSRDLVNWTLIGHALPNLPHPRYAEVQPGCGVWAPALRFHAGQYWLYFPTPDEGIYVVTAPHPAGPWSEPWLVQGGLGLIDPCPFWDDDGRAWLIHAYAGSRAGIKHRLCLRPMAPDGRSLLGEGTIVYHNPERHPTLEGPKLLKRNGWYYISAPAGGVATGWQVIFRSRHIAGPYEEKIVLAQGRTDINGPHQGALLDAPDGRWWFVHFQDAGVYGRIVHLQPVTWHEDWPLLGDWSQGDCGQPVTRHEKPVLRGDVTLAAPATSDDFTNGQLGPQWQWHANHAADWHSLTARPGWLRLHAPAQPQPDLAAWPGLLLQKFPARTFAVETSLDFSGLQPGAEAGLVVMGRNHAALAIRRHPGTLELIWLVNHEIRQTLPLPGTEIRLRLRVREGGLCVFGYFLNGEWETIAEIFGASAGVWIGAKTGLYCRQLTASAQPGHADFEYFRFFKP